MFFKKLKKEIRISFWIKKNQNFIFKATQYSRIFQDF